MIQTQERRPGTGGGVQRLGGALDEQYRRALRTAIASIVEVGIDALDVLDGDPDLENDGTELDGDVGAEDAFHSHYELNAPAGCPFADPPDATCLRLTRC